MKSQLILQPKQIEARALAQSKARFILFRGGSRSGKSMVVAYLILMRALSTPNSRHGIFRKTAVDVRKTLFDLTFKKVMNIAFPGLWDTLVSQRKINDTEMSIELPNGSMIFFAGLDDSVREDRILGDEFSTVWINEATQFRTFGIISKIIGRLSEAQPTINGNLLTPKLFIDCNPSSKKHWSFVAFSETDGPEGPPRVRLNPSDNSPHPRPEEWAEIKMLSIDNAEHISKTYIKDLENMSSRDRKRFLQGEWQNDNDNALFNSMWFDKNRLPARAYDETDDLIRIIVAVDPAISSHAHSDETGIIVAGIDADGHCYVLEDCSLKAQPQAWAERAVDAYERWNADCIVAEKNQGGEMVAQTMRAVNSSAPITLVHASRGKVIRAEPVSVLYDRGMVHHCGVFNTLENQLEDFTIDFNRRQGSPDRLDALVWAINELAIKETSVNKVKSQRVAGFW